MHENFFAKISHEVRTPINAIIGFGFLFQQTRLDDQQRKYLSTILASAEDLLQTFQGILDFSTAEDGSLQLQKLPMYVENLMENVAHIIHVRCQEKSLKFSYNIAENVPKAVSGDSIRLSQAILNIANNAVKYTNEGRVHIQVESMQDDKHTIRFSILDTGIGVPEEFSQSIFEPFMQVDNSHTRIYGGAGLGLATSKQLITLMGGEVGVSANTIDGQGSIFTINIPLEEAEYGSVVFESPLVGKKILILDHDPMRMQSIAASMTSLGIESITCDDPDESLKMIAEADAGDVPFTFVLMAWQMPGMDSMETAQYIQQIPTKHLAPSLLLMSDYSLSEIYSLALEAGFFDLVETPANIETFRQTLMAALEEQEHNAKLHAEAQENQDEEEISTRILLVEDNEINQEIAYEVLSSAEYVVDIANNGQEAVEAVEKTKYGLVLMDIQMPILDGLEATKKIRAAGHKMPIIAMTAHGMADDKETSISAGMNAHLTKPLEPMALFATMTKWLPTAATSNKVEHPKKEVLATEHTIVRKEKLPQSMEGFNLEGGLATVGGNEALYISLLRKFADRYAYINKDISDCIQKNDIETAIRHAHTVRGIAANLGAEALSSAAEALEKAIALAPSMTAPHLRTLVLRLTSAVDAIHENLGYSATSADSDVAKEVNDCLNMAEREHARHVLDQSIKYMEKDWGHANDTVQYLSERLENTEAEHPLKELKQALEDFEVERAQELSLTVQHMLHKEE